MRAQRYERWSVAGSSPVGNIVVLVAQRGLNDGRFKFEDFVKMLSYF